jgi:hypothetical protein
MLAVSSLGINSEGEGLSAYAIPSLWSILHLNHDVQERIKMNLYWHGSRQEISNPKEVETNLFCEMQQNLPSPSKSSIPMTSNVPLFLHVNVVSAMTLHITSSEIIWLYFWNKLDSAVWSSVPSLTDQMMVFVPGQLSRTKRYCVLGSSWKGRSAAIGERTPGYTCWATTWSFRKWKLRCRLDGGMPLHQGVSFRRWEGKWEIDKEITDDRYAVGFTLCKAFSAMLLLSLRVAKTWCFYPDEKTLAKGKERVPKPSCN